MIKYFLSLFLLILNLVYLHSQDLGKHFISNYNRSDYNASIANWSCAEDLIGNIYFANFDGILKYNGNSWSLISLKDNIVALSIGIDKKNKIYVGSLKDFGVLKINQKGNFYFSSFKKYLPNDLTFEKIENIKVIDNDIYFISKDIIFKWDGSKIIFWEIKNNYFTSEVFQIDEDVCVITQMEGVAKLKENKLEYIPHTKNVSKSILLKVIGSQSEIIPNHNGINSPSIFYNNKVETLSKNSLSDYINKNILITIANNSINNASKEFSYAMSSLNGKGIILTDKQFNLINTITKDDGLIGEKVRNLFLDQKRILWAAFQNGISKIEMNSPWEYWDESRGLKGTIWDIKKYNEVIYIASTEGVFYLKEDHFYQVKGINSKVWTLSKYIDKKGNDILLAGANDGLYSISGNFSKKLLSLSTVTKIFSLNDYQNLIIGHKNGINLYRIKSNELKTIKKLKNNTFFDIKKISNSLWISSKFVGVYKISDWNSNTPKITLLDSKNGFKDVNQINIIKKNNSVYFASYNGFYQLTNDSTLNSINDEFFFRNKKPIKIMSIKETKNNGFFVSISENRKEHLEYWQMSQNNKNIKINIPYNRLPEAEISAIFPDKDSILWIATTAGLFKYDAKIPKDYTLPFNTVISQTSTTDDSVLFYGNYYNPEDTAIVPSIVYEQPDSFKPVLEYKDNNITFEYAATFYEVPEKNEFSYFLENNDEHWSHWSTENKKEYNNLPAGKYTFKVKSRNIYETIGRTATYEFTILPPWYQTAWAYVIFTIAGLFCFWFILLAYSYRVRLHRRNLKLIVADRTFEVMSQKKKLEEKQEEILDMNQKLSELNTSLEQKVQQRTSKIVTTLKKLQKTNNELDTFVYKASHDLKNPLTQIIGLVTLAKREHLDKNAKEYLQRIEETSFNMEELLHKLTEVHETFNKDVTREDIDFYETINDIIGEFKKSEACQNTTLTFDTEKNTHITTDSFLLDIILKKLLENAIVYRKDELEPHEISIATSQKENIFFIRIKDNGIGIDEEHYDKVYDMFFRGTERSKGNGLGLYLVNQSVEKLHGNISFTSIKDEYTEFTVSIPT